MAPDVRSNALGEPRLFVILMDDATTPTDSFMVNMGKKIANGIIDRGHHLRRHARDSGVSADRWRAAESGSRLRFHTAGLDAKTVIRRDVRFAVR